LNVLLIGLFCLVVVLICIRLGEMFGIFALSYLKYNWTQVNEWNTKIAERPMDCPNYYAMQWYCLYLKQIKGRTDLDCLTNHPCSMD
jgi:hypothetical protein